MLGRKKFGGKKGLRVVSWTNIKNGTKFEGIKFWFDKDCVSGRKRGGCKAFECSKIMKHGLKRGRVWSDVRRGRIFT